MKTLEFETRGLLQLLEDEGVNIICDGNMDLKISDEDLVLMKELVSDFATVVEYDDYVVLLKTMKTFTTITGEMLKVSANHSKRTFIIVNSYAKYRTIPLSKEEFNSCLNNTGDDWVHFLRSSDYYKV